MDKKPLIVVSICAVVLLVLGSLSNVVGYQSVKTSVNDSPLFQTRTQRATNQQQNSITSQYLGLGKENFLQIPLKDTKNELLKKVTKIVSKMDDKTFSRFVELLIQRIKNDENLSSTNINEIIQLLQQIRLQAEIVSSIVVLLVFLLLFIFIFSQIVLLTSLTLFLTPTLSTVCPPLSKGVK
jgi:hypothetical protein